MEHQAYIRNVQGAKTAVLMIHGICSTPRHFDFLLPRIPEDVSVYNILLKGHGGDVKDFAKATMKDWKRQVRQYLEELSDSHEEVIVVGFSLGTLLALNAAETFPKVKGLLLLNAPLSPFIKPIMFPRNLRMTMGKTDVTNVEELTMSRDLSIRLSRNPLHYLPWIPNFVSLLQLSAHCRKTAKYIGIPCYAFFGGRDELVSLRSLKSLPRGSDMHIFVFDHSTHCYYEPEFIRIASESLSKLINE